MGRGFTYLSTVSLLLAIGALTPSCQQKPSGSTLFTDLPGEKTGIYFENNLSYSEKFNMIDYLYYYDGGGVAIGDINNDGLSDIYLVANEGNNALYLNRGNMRFEDISESAGVKSPGLWKTGVSMVDINGDGLLDIYLCRLGSYKGVTGKNELYINQGDLTFKEEASLYNLDFAGFSTQVAFFDMDNDGDLDAYLLNHSVHAGNSFEDPSKRLQADSLAGDRIYINQDNYFVDITANSGIYQSALGYGLGIGLSDINQDGFTDVLVANDFIENDFLYLNNGNGTFTDGYHQMADYTSLSSMGCDLGDFNNDGLIDIITLDMLPESELIRKSIVGEDPLEIFNMKLQMGYMPQYKRNMLQLNRGDGTFSDIAMMAGVHATDWSWAPLFADFNNDGWKDLFISNGIKGRPNDQQYLHFINSEQVTGNPRVPDSVLFNAMPTGNASNYFFRNNHDLTFANVSKAWGSLPELITQGVAYGDLDNDGDLDLVLNNLDHQSIIKQNNSTSDSSSHYLSIKLTGVSGNTRAIGAKAEVYHNSDYQLLEMYPVRGFKSSVDYRLHFGLGNSLTIDSLIITWPGGHQSKVKNVPADQEIHFSQKDASPPHTAQDNPTPIFTIVSSDALGVDFVHRENNFIEFNREPLIPHMHSREGPALTVADVNQDGLDDFFIGGAKHQPACIYLQTTDGFTKSYQPALAADQLFEDVDAGFFDFDGDGDQDLMVVSGGNEFQGNSPNRQPRLYLNDGKGLLTRSSQAFDGVYQTGSSIAINDFDGDGWLDVFLGSQVEPWNYGVAPKSYLLKNQEGKSFHDVSDLLPNGGALGMINDAEWVDLGETSGRSLVLAGEWMNIAIVTFNGSGFELNAIPESAGWWKSVHGFDYDGDGDQDLLVGNLGLNSKLKADPDHPLNLYLGDFDQNGKSDPLITITNGENESLFASESMLTRQIPSISRLLGKGLTYAEATPQNLFNQELTGAYELQVQELRSGVYINQNNQFRFVPFPNMLQVSPILDFITTDIKADGTIEILSVGNLFPASMLEGRYAAGRGAVLAVAKQRHEIYSNRETGISTRGDVRNVALIEFQGIDLLLVATNNDSIQWFKRR